MRNTCCAAAVLALGALAAAEDVIPPQAVVAQYFFVRSFEGDSLNPATLTENRRAIADLEEAIEKWGRYRRVVREEQALERERPFVIEELFEVVIESSKVGLRKPDPRIYHLACEALAVTPNESAFLDDIGANLKGARALGMTTIRVDHTLSAIDELETALGFPLPRSA